MSRTRNHRHDSAPRRFGPVHLRATVLALALAALLSLSALACSGGPSSAGTEAASTGSASATTEATTTASAPEPATPPAEASAEDFDPAIFDPESSFVVDNPYLPLEPGTRWVNRGWTDEDGERIPHAIVFTITDLVKEIGGVRALVGWDRDFRDGQLAEAELIFFAQDRGGNVWHLGEYAEVYDDEGEFVGGQAWLAGEVEGAKAGIMMHAQPRLGMPAYSEGFAPDPFNWNDWGKIYKVGARTCVPADCYEDVLVTDEFEPTKPGAHQLKYYAPGVGNIRTGWRGSDPDKEELTLRRLVHLSPAELEQARAHALELETRASDYGETAPATQRPS
jgi:hypothetical protein